MTSLQSWLESKQSDLVASLEAAITAEPQARILTHPQVSALVLALSVAIDQGPTVLDILLQQWHKEVPSSGIQGRNWTSTLAAIRQETWASVISEFSPVKALQNLRVLEGLLMHAVALAAELDQNLRMAELEQRLSQAQQQVERVDQSKADFISIAAHELKTPLTLIEGYANMLIAELEKLGSGNTEILLGGIANGTHRLREIIESMIDVSLIDSRVLDISFQPIYLRQIITMATRDLSDVFRIRQIELTIDEFDQDGAPTLGDPERLYQAIFNVLGNAIKFTPDGGQIHIKNRHRPVAEEDPETIRGYLELEIIDTGIGIAPENLELIFSKFSGLGDVALHSTSKYKFRGGGAGLGLAITRGIIQSHGGAIWAESPGYDEELLPGSTFHILLPLYDEPPENVTS